MAENRIDFNDRGLTDDRNRAYDTRRDDDLFKTPSINIYDIDYAILYQLKERLASVVTENGAQVPVPVMFAAGETWSQIQRHGYLRDRSRKIMAPVIVLKRNSILPDDRMERLKISGDTAATQLIYFPDQQHNNQNDWIHKTEMSQKSHTYFVSVIPEFVKVSYDIFIWTDLMSQMNEIIDQIIMMDRRLWGDAMTFNTSLGDFSFETINDAGTDRLVRCTLPIEVDGFLQNEYDLRESTVRKAHTVKRVHFKNELEQDAIYPDMRPKIIRFGQSRIDPKKF